MRKVILTLTIVLSVFMINAAKAQTTTATAIVNVTLAAVQSIAVTQGTVTIPFATSADYNTGVTVAQADHLTASSSGQFFIRVKSNADLTGPAAATIPISTISLTPTAGTTAAPGSPVYNTIASLSTSDQDLVTSTGGCNAAKFNVSYKASGGANYLNKAVGTYTATLTYTIAAL